MGVVYRAEHVGTGDLVALKTVRVADVAMLSSMRREIHQLGRLRHDGVVRVSDDGVFDGLPWYAMEYIDGVTLRVYGAGHGLHETRQYLPPPSSDDTHVVSTRESPQNGPLARRRQAARRIAHRARPLVDVLSVVRRLCSALSYMHGEGLVHRDLKPENILVLPNEQPVLVDFGIATRFGGGFGRDVLEVEGAAAGTLAYMSPEQIRGDTVDARADLYALGCILFELITGHPPFQGPTAVIIARAHQHLDPARPSTIVEDVPAELDELVLRLLEKDPGKRLGYADDVAARLARIGARNGSHAPRPRPYLYRPGFAGRREGLAQLTDRFVPGFDRPASIVFVGGESGIGKTRLMREVAKAAERSGVRVIAGECSPRLTTDAGRAAGSHLLEPLRAALFEIIDRCTQRGRVETERLLGARGPILAEFEPRIYELLGDRAATIVPELDANAARRRLFVALADTFEALASDCPLLLILDDLQWMDELTLGFLEFVVDEANRRVPPFGIFGTYRSDEVGEGLGRLVERSGVVTRTIGRLADDDVAAIIRDMLALDPAPPALCATLCRLSEGNPFFVAEYLRAAVEGGMLTRDDGGRWQVSNLAPDESRPTEIEHLPLPGTLQELIERRLEGLAGDVLAVAEAASVLGREADADLLRMTSAVDEAVAERAIAELVRRHVLEEAASGRVRFTHEKIREIMYGSLSVPRRSELHRLAATAISRVDDVDEMQGILGLHWERAGESERARVCYLAGARTSVRRFAFAEAEQLYKSYLALRADPSPELVEAMNELGNNVLRTRGRPHDALAMQQQALGLALVIGDRAGEARSLRMAGLILKELGELERAEAQLTSALAVAVAEGDRESESLGCNYLAGMYYERGQPERALELFERGLAIARELGDDRNEAVILSNIAILHVEGGRWQPARDAYVAAIDIQTRIGDLNCLQATLSNYAYLQAEAGNFAEASEMYERALDVARSTSRRRFEGIVLSNMADLARDEGDLERARALCEQSIAIHEEIGNRRWVGITLESLASIELAAWRIDEATEHLRQALDIHIALGNRGYEGSALVLKAQIARRTGDIAAAASLLEDAQSAIAELGDPRLVASWLCETAHVAIDRGERANAMLASVRQCTEGLDLAPASRLGREIAHLGERIAQSPAPGTP